jgi:unsaturated rhamnogalacturonyl hydrolase
MNKHAYPTTLALLCLPLVLTATAAYSQTQNSVVSMTAVTAAPRPGTRVILRRVLNWQMPRLKPAKGWERGVLLAGIANAYANTGDPIYKEAILAQGNTNDWQLGKRVRHADDQCVGQGYTELYLLEKDPKAKNPHWIAALKTNLDTMLSVPEATKKLDWNWCDALFMAPPAFAELSLATGDPKYREFMHREWQRSTDLLYDTKEHLFFRDARFKPRNLTPAEAATKKFVEANGKKVFWSRGDGWVLAGTARVLEFLPKDDPKRGVYENLLREMSARIAPLQGADGLWRASLLDPESYPAPETSGTGLFCYAMAWGINNGVLDRATYEPVVRKAWNGLVDSVESSGKLTRVQPGGDRPVKFPAEHTTDFGVGAFMLAGSEMIALDKK